ncbi:MULTISPECIES: pyridoxine 5'-phosphate synthase [Moraxella]|uniref:Pyridoxine 5'-phosphate synthase n=1 Tax=Moraxella lacunata TaxID=477 RepID=A0A1B8Q703_MORLA|nr:MULTISPECIES: pyridoxine 5'-phosphate synthase [Moraxella]MBE9578008.1 pyridoxine 5'-phosphate synthase [Moraxella sp. K1664]MBE9587711.1 pyridoxine 5'-phosphate synthase [Moraxella sp. K1630]MBE9590344.1 pyridoxine 5'-phosphate synthase [Moraxella sp. K127]MBE9595712.1 pyridoxine 5'-phosphate synthase [Moraxella sp. K2450]MDH9218080.1 pyridoxine 5'-phosphate synthase [Moraxella lacunata]
MKTPRLGVNIDHIATLRNARGVDYPCPVKGAVVCEQAGADGITLHLREDRRHIKDVDVYAMKEAIGIPMNLEMAVTDEMLAIARDVRPQWVCLVPEKRQEVTTEGGLDVINNDKLPSFIKDLQNVGIKVSLFIDPDTAQIERAIELGADAIEIHTGAYAERCLENDKEKISHELDRVKMAVAFALSKHPSFLVNAGHGLTVDNVAPIAQIDGVHELNIGHSIIADSVFVGLDKAVKNMRQAFSD